MKKGFRYIDLFAGIGGFHLAMDELGGKCVFASEIDNFAIETYSENFGVNSSFDITKVHEDTIPEHEVLCAGFPCQAFSKAGKQSGLYDTRGTLFFEIERILRKHKTKYIILENVRNLVSHDRGNTWNVIINTLKDIGYRTTEKPLIISPHSFGIPQLRERVFILGIYDPINVSIPLKIDLPKLKRKSDNSIYSVLESIVGEDYKISDHETYVLNAWDEFYAGIKEDIIGFPIWFDWFKKKPEEEFAGWKKDFIEKNNNLYLNNKEFIESWILKYRNLEDFTPTQRKFEWQAGTRIKSLWEGVIQFRPSGVRVKYPDCFPALVAIVQVPIIGKYKRRLTVRESARLQSFPDSFEPNPISAKAYKQFGNAVNVNIVSVLATELFKIQC